jgi:hypothetical protein
MLDSTNGRRVATLITLGFLAGACSDATVARPGRFNPARVEAGVAAVERAAASPVLVSLQVVARAAGSVAAAPATGAAGVWSDGLDYAVRRLATVTTDVGAALIPVMRPSVLGKTFVYDPASRTYVPDAARTGAPPNGVRFILYETAANGEPTPTREIGFADLTDERRSSPNMAGVRLVVVTGGVTRLSYSFDLTGSLEAASVAVRGFLSDGSERLEFSINTSQQLFGRGGKASLDATLAIPQHDFTVTAKAEGVAGEANGDGKVNLTITSGSDAIVAQVQTVEGQLDASFKVNGQLLATATGDPRSPVIRGQGGRELTDEEQHALGAIVSMADSLFKLVSDLLQPAGVLLLIALGVGG